jgi:outer membrane protein assembly factor BamE (lipoprotein component of BamABCDE complex)
MKKFINLKILIILVFIVCCTQKPVIAQKSKIEVLQSKVKILQKKISQLENKIARLEKLLSSDKATSVSSQHGVNSDGWKDKQNWKKLKKGMSKEEVKKVLGKPGKIRTASYGDTWYYPDVLGGRVNFDAGRVEGWSEP